MDYPGLDDAFLRYIHATPENQRHIQGFYLPFFVERQGVVVDLACGHGDFVQLLTEHGVQALGVDLDPACCAELRRRGIDVVCDDVLNYLQGLDENSLAGITSFHLVEHLPYPKVLQLIHLAYRALAPGGLILLATPNVRALYTHLESFYMHFGHVSFYHPRLLSFFLDYAGFHEPRVGENPRMAHPLWRNDKWLNLGTLDARESYPPVRYNPQLPSVHQNVLGQVSKVVKNVLVRFLVQPLLDQVVAEVNRRFRGLDQRVEALRVYGHKLNANLNATHQRLTALDRSVECYVYATKGEVDLALPDALRGTRL